MTVWIQNPFDNLPVEGYRKQRYWLMAEAFVRAGHRVVLWTSDFNHTTKRKRQVAGAAVGQTLAADGFEVRFVPTRPYRRNVGLERIRSHRAYARDWERLALACAEGALSAKPDMVVSSIPTIGGAEAAVRLGRRFGARVVVDVQDAWPETFERLAPRRWRWLARWGLAGLRRRAQGAYREADVVTGVCERYRDLTGRDDYQLAYLGIEMPPRPARPVPHGDAVRTVRLAYAGNLGVTYDLGTVIRALGEARRAGREVALEVAGKGQGEAAWRRLAQELGVAERVTFHGYLSEEKLRALLGTCDIGIVPMPADSFVGIPNKFADYSSAGLAILSSLGGESEGLLRKYGCGEGYAAGSVASFAAALGRILPRVDEARRGARQMAAEEFDARRIYDEYVRRVAQTKEERT